MDDFLGEFVYSALAFSYLGSLILSPVYLAWATTRSARRRRLPPNPVDLVALRAWRALTGDADVAFEARWGMVLAVPAVALMLLAFVDPARAPMWAWLSGFVLLGIYIVAILALNRVPVPWWAQWLPSVFAIAITPLAAVTFALGGGWPWVSFFVYSRLGIGYIADVVVGVRFARAVHARDVARALANKQAAGAGVSNFVWPH